MNKKRLIIMVIVAAAVLLLAPSCTTPTNRGPIITSLEAEAEWAFTLGSLQVTCNATDPDGDKLSYEWSASGGNITGTGAAVNWIAPEEAGMYDITVMVTDSQGANAMESIALIASNRPPPTIENLIVTAKDPRYLKESTVAGCDYDVWITEECYIECIASGTGELFYEWSCTGGNISGEGSTITWTPPNKFPVDVTVMVIVSDVAGNKINRNMVFHIPSCACDF